MTREEALTEWVIPAIRKTWNEKKCDEILKALEQEPKYCDRNICIRNEHNGIECGECEVTKSQEPCEDAISRQAVIDIIDKWVKNTGVLIALPTNEVTPLFESVHELPSVQSKQKTGHWIPISERLPENESRVLVTIQTPMRSKVRSGMFENKRFYNDNGDTWKVTDKEVKAWMPLPEPFKAESEK